MMRMSVVRGIWVLDSKHVFRAVLRTVSILLLTTLVLGCGKTPSPSNKDSQSASNQTSDNSETSSTETTSSDSNKTQINVADVAPTGAKIKPGSDEVQIISFDDLNLGMQEDAKFRPVFLTYNDGRAKRLLGRRVNLAGVMNATDELRGVKEFVLLKNKECKFGPGGQADHLMQVFMKEGETTNYTEKILYVEGTLSLNPIPLEGPYTWSIYDLKDATVSTRPPRG